MQKRIPYGPAVLLFALFFLYMVFFEKTNIYQTRDYHDHTPVSNVSVSEVIDTDTPLGLKTTYKFTIDSLEETENCLAFYLVHQFAEVYFDDTLVYSLTPDSNSRVGESPTCNWVNIPLYSGDIGTEVRIDITPVFKDVEDRKVDFLVGSHFDVFADCLVSDLPELVFSCLCIALGTCILAVHFVNRRYKQWNILYLGMMAFLIGLWKLTDLPLMPMLFPSLGKAMGYIALESILLVGTTVLLYAKQVFLHVKTPALDRVTIINYIAMVVILLLQVFNIYDLRETLFLSHVGLVIIILTIDGTAVKNWEYLKNCGHPGLYRFFVFGLTFCLTADMLMYYFVKDGLNMIFSLWIFLIYCGTAFILHVLETSRKVYTDTMTGLFNKAKWNEAVSENLLSEDNTAIIMLDLNTLKEINDLYGHDVGDRLIFNFATILKDTLPNETLICRWGGDEFAVMLNNVTHEYINNFLTKLEIVVAEHNETEEQAKISYATGFAISSDYKNISSEELFKKADENMYLMKQEWYRKNK